MQCITLTKKTLLLNKWFFILRHLRNLVSNLIFADAINFIGPVALSCYMGNILFFLMLSG